MRYILLPPPLPANSQAQLIPPTTAQVQQPSIQTTAAGTVQDQQNTNERSISEQNVLDNPKLPQDFKDKLQDYSEKLKRKKPELLFQLRGFIHKHFNDSVPSE